MALNKPGLKTTILALLVDLSQRVEDPSQAREDFADRLANAIDLFVKSGTVSVTVTTSGTATTHTGTGTGAIS